MNMIGCLGVAETADRRSRGSNLLNQGQRLALLSVLVNGKYNVDKGSVAVMTPELGLQISNSYFKHCNSIGIGPAGTSRSDSGW